ncbi:MAG: KH domain-containing protein [Patescibacteria group bacterium]|nr:KH domain-containing protein [Patescibacteria group bacterium]MDE2590309.1 KH domain-containing protein [Patescibacteria group bacterium]
MKDALHFLIASIVDNTDALSIEESEQEGMVDFVIHVAKEDMGKVIGKEGKVIRAIRNVMKIPAIKQHKKIHISIAEE